LLWALDCAILEGRGSERVELGLERVREFSWDITAKETLQVYRELATGILQ
jgi:hypothetical protein